MPQNLQAGFLLHHQNYRESSLLIDVFTQGSGRITLIAKGVRRQKSPFLGLLRPFTPLNISYTGTNNLKTLTHVEAGSAEKILPGINTYCGFYLNELLRYFIPADEPYPDVFLNYLSCLQQLKTTEDIEAALRVFEIQLLQSVGYALQLESDCITGLPIQAAQTYQYEIEQGATIKTSGPYQGDTLIAMSQSQYSTECQLFEAKQLMRKIIDFYLQGKALQSRNLILKHIQRESCKSN